MATNRPPGFKSAISGVRELIASKSSMVNSTPASRAIASRCSTALVEPPVAATATMAFSIALRVRICDNVTFFFDTFRDRRNGFEFTENSIGGRLDGQTTGERQWSGDWNAIWDSRVGRFEGGWIVETAMVLSTEYFLQQSVEDASRRIRIGKVATDATNATQFKALVCAQLWVVTNCSGTVAIWVNNAADFATLAPPQPLTVDTGDTLPYVPGVGQRAVAVIATYDWTFTVPGMTFLSNVSGSKRRLQGVSVFRNEPF